MCINRRVDLFNYGSGYEYGVNFAYRLSCYPLHPAGLRHPAATPAATNQLTVLHEPCVNRPDPDC